MSVVVVRSVSEGRQLISQGKFDEFLLTSGPVLTIAAGLVQKAAEEAARRAVRNAVREWVFICANVMLAACCECDDTQEGSANAALGRG